MKRKLVCLVICVSLMAGLISVTPAAETHMVTAAADVVQEKQPVLQAIYGAPANGWQEEATPLGNGFLGAMVFGGVSSDRIQVNEHSLWEGGPGQNCQRR